MRVLDASSIILGWDVYPLDQFPPFWAWISEEIAGGNLAIPVVAFEEVHLKAPDCAAWLTNSGVTKLPTTGGILQVAMQIKAAVGIQDDNYHPKGVGENDILIIATAKVHNAELISDEERQNNLPNEPRKRKIPAVCDIAGVGVRCISFLEYLKGSNRVFRA